MGMRAADSMPVRAGIGQRRTNRISSINTGVSLRSAGSLESAGWGIPFGCFVGVELGGIDLAALHAVL
jgi:hypothetical protein